MLWKLNFIIENKILILSSLKAINLYYYFINYYFVGVAVIKSTNKTTIID